jgi:hypothetical protein
LLLANELVDIGAAQPDAFEMGPNLVASPMNKLAIALAWVMIVPARVGLDRSLSDYDSENGFSQVLVANHRKYQFPNLLLMKNLFSLILYLPKSDETSTFLDRPNVPHLWFKLPELETRAG